MTSVALVNAEQDRGVKMRYNTATLPSFTLWKNTDTLEDGYVTGLEPGTGFPSPRPLERQAGRVPSLPGGSDVSFELQIQVLQGKEAVDAAKAEVSSIQAGRPAHTNPQPVRTTG
uniref:Uncharacterized protein n=1 Tax=Haptolina brevifila TaxID=156173 RepID=A0A7S2GNE2_9EUKA